MVGLSVAWFKSWLVSVCWLCPGAGWFIISYCDTYKSGFSIYYRRTHLFLQGSWRLKQSQGRIAATFSPYISKSALEWDHSYNFHSSIQCMQTWACSISLFVQGQFESGWQKWEAERERGLGKGFAPIKKAFRLVLVFVCSLCLSCQMLNMANTLLMLCEVMWNLLPAVCCDLPCFCLIQVLSSFAHLNLQRWMVEESHYYIV